MQKFLLNEKQKMEELNKAVIIALEKYNRKDYDADKYLLKVVDDCIGFYKNNNTPIKENEMVALKTEMITSIRGINPRTLERISIRRNEMKEITAFRVLQALAESIRIELTKVIAVIDEARTLIMQMIMAALQAGILTEAVINSIKKQTDIEQMWNGFSNDPNLSLVQKRVKLFASQPDIILLCDETLSGLRS